MPNIGKTMLRIILLIGFLIAQTHIIFAGRLDTLILLDRPDFFEISHTRGDTVIYSYFVGKNGIIEIDSKDYSGAQLYKVNYSIGPHLFLTKEYHNKGDGNWDYYQFDSMGKLKEFGKYLETDSTYVVFDTLTGSYPEPPYIAWEYSYIFHTTTKVGKWLIFDKNNQQAPKEILYRRE